MEYEDDDVLDALQQTGNESMGTFNSQAGGKTSIILLNKIYKKISMNTVIKLLIRIKKLYEAMYEVRKILQLIMKQEEMFNEEVGILYTCVHKYEKDLTLTLSDQDESVFLRGIQVLQKVSRRIVQF